MPDIAPPVLTSSGLTIEHLAKALAAADKPVSAKWVRDQQPKTLKVSDEVFQSLLSEAVQGGVAFRFGKPEKALYWHSAPQAWVRQCCQQKLAGTTRSKSEVIGAISKLSTVQGVISKAEVESIFKDLVKSGVIQTHPSYIGSRTALFSVRPVDPLDYLTHAIEKLSEKLKVAPSELTALVAKMNLNDEIEAVSHSTNETHSSDLDGVFRPEAAEAPAPLADEPSPESPANSGPEFILQAMHDINPRVATGDVVSLVELRRRLDFQFDKEAFDQAILDLASDWRIALHRDDFAGTKTDAEREVLVRDNDGKFYNVASLRSPS